MCLRGGARRRRLSGGARAPARRLCRPPHAALPRRPPERALRRHRLPQARGPLPHRRPQDQQRARPDAPRGAHGQAPRDRRDRRRPARCRHRHRLRPAGSRVRGVHGCRRHPPPGAERGAHGPARGDRDPRRERLAHAQGRHERGAARLGDQRARHLLRHRFGGRTGALPGHGARLPAGDRGRGARAAARAPRPPARRGRRLCRRRLQRHGPVPCVPRRPGAPDRGRGRRRGSRHGPPRRLAYARTPRRAPRLVLVPAAGRLGPGARSALRVGRPRLPRRGARALLAERQRPRPVCGRHRCRGSGGVSPDRSARGHHPGARERSRPRLRAARTGRLDQVRRRRSHHRQPLRAGRQGRPRGGSAAGGRRAGGAAGAGPGAPTTDAGAAAGTGEREGGS